EHVLRHRAGFGFHPSATAAQVQSNVPGMLVVPTGLLTAAPFDYHLNQSPSAYSFVRIPAGHEYTPITMIGRKIPVLLGFCGGRGQNRTVDTTIFSRTVTRGKSACFRRFACACTHRVPAAAVFHSQSTAC